MNASKLKRSFTARLNSRVIHRICGADIADTGWLVQEAYPEPGTTFFTLHFDLLDELTQKFRITCEYPKLFAGHRLDISRNGYLGFYDGAGDVHWYLKVVSGQPGRGMVIHIYDQEHKAVSYFDNLYLGVGGSRPALDLEVTDYVEL